MTHTDLAGGWRLALIPPDCESPMPGHRGGDMAVDAENRTIYGWEIFAVIYGLDAVVRACEKYIG